MKIRCFLIFIFQAFNLFPGRPMWLLTYTSSISGEGHKNKGNVINDLES